MVRNFVGRNKLVRKILISGLSWSERVDPRISKLRILHAKNVPLQHLQHSTRHLQHDGTLTCNTCNTIHALLRKREWLFSSQCNTALRRALLCTRPRRTNIRFDRPCPSQNTTTLAAGDGHMVYKICITSNSGTPENLPSKFRRFSQNAETLLVRVYFGPEFGGPEFGVSLYLY